MATYALLVLPAFTRVYGAAAPRLAAAELAAFGQTALSAPLSEIAERDIAGVGYLGFTAAAELTEQDIALLSAMSSVHALFEVRGELLRPLTVRPPARVSSDLLTIQKYSGKTNELFTQLLLNLTLLARAEPAELLSEKLTVFDPMCGRGTTLNQALRYGYHAVGMDLDGQDLDSYAHFIQTWLKNHRIRHRTDTAPLRRAKRLHLTLSLTEQDRQEGVRTEITVVHADTLRAVEFFGPDSADLIVTDAPYGVQHGSRPSAGGLSRSPLDLVRAAAPVWAETLRPGGALGISWNVHVARRAELAAALAEGGLEVLDEGPFAEFEHRVEQAILRDLVIARKPVRR